MKTIIEPARSVDVVLETEVLVVGSGPGRSSGGACRGARRRAHGAHRS